MSIKFRLYQNNKSKSEQYKKWYGRALTLDTIGTDEIADIIESNCTVKRSDILAVLSELVVTMKRELQASNSVRLDRLGLFKIGITTGPADSQDDFDPKKNVKGMHIIFLPESRLVGGKRVKTLLDGAKVAELPSDVKDRKKEKKAAAAETQNP